MDKLYLSKSQYERYLDNLITDIKENFDPDMVVSIETGGLYVGEPIAKALEKPHRSIKVSFYDGETKRSSPKLDNIIWLDPNKKYLICDDLIDSGSTIKFIKNFYSIQTFKTAVLLQNKKADIKADFFADYYSGKWVVFSWEKELNSY